MMQNDKLLPCPFCGGEMEIINVKLSPLLVRNFIYKCKNQCIESIHSFNTEAEAIKASNTRRSMYQYQEGKMIKEER